MQALEFKVLTGSEAREYLHEIARLSAVLFKEYPYLYDADFEADSEYLEQYFISRTSIIILVFDNNDLIGCSFAMALQEEIQEILEPFQRHHFSIEDCFYIGAVMIKNAYRKYAVFDRIKNINAHYVHDNGYKHIAFTTVRRDENHPACPANYLSPEKLWSFIGFRKIDDMTVVVEWQRVDTGTEEMNDLDVWYKTLN